MTPRSLERRRRRRSILVALAFLAPALVFLCGILLYPVVYTVIRSFYSPSGQEFVGLANYVHMFTSDSTFTAIRNNIIWVGSPRSPAPLSGWCSRC